MNDEELTPEEATKETQTKRTRRSPAKKQEETPEPEVQEEGAADEEEPEEVDPVEILNSDGEALFMRTGYGWVTPSGVAFSREHPYQIVPASEAQYLLETERFERATREQVKNHYNL